MRGWLAVPLIGWMARTTGSSRPPTVSRVNSPSRTRRTSFVWRRSRPSRSTPWRSCTSPSTGRRSGLEERVG
jgi:hypothetical protein